MMILPKPPSAQILRYLSTLASSNEEGTSMTPAGLEAIDGLYDECIMDEEDKDYKKGRKSALDSHYGAQ